MILNTVGPNKQVCLCVYVCLSVSLEVNENVFSQCCLCLIVTLFFF